MNVVRIAFTTAILAGICAGADATRRVEKPSEELVRELGDEKYKVREAATRALWEIGLPALEALKTVAEGKDPEMAVRARELIRKIELEITPETDPAVMDLAERYGRATPGEKTNLLEQMKRRKAWRLMLKLFATETAPDEAMLAVIDHVPVTAARERLLEGDAQGAREFLEMAPATPPNLLALAEFHRSQGTLDAEINRAKTLPADKVAGYLLALYRAQGNLTAARQAAVDAGEAGIAAQLAILEGDPLPWLSLPNTDADGASKVYTELAIRRWKGEQLTPADLDPLVRSAAGRSQRGTAGNALLLLGESTPAESALLKRDPMRAFNYFESLERMPQAFQAVGLDPENPDYRAWIGKRIAQMSGKDADEDHDVDILGKELVTMASMMERRGLYRECREAFLDPMLKLAADDDDTFQNFLTTLFRNEDPLKRIAPKTGAAVAAAWAGDDDARWNDVLIAVIGEENDNTAVWDWLGELDSKASRAERLEGLLALFGIGKDTDHLREHWLNLAWTSLNATPEEKRGPVIGHLGLLTRNRPDLAMGMKLWEMTPADKRMEFFVGPAIDLGVAGHWLEAADSFLRQVQQMEKAKIETNPAMHAFAAACLRKAGREQEAVEQDTWVAKLALGCDAFSIALAYSYGEDHERAMEWWQREAREGGTDSEEYPLALYRLGDVWLEEGKWKESGAIFEILAQVALTRSLPESGVNNLQLRAQSDLGRALAKLPEDRAGAIAMLERCHEYFPSDGSLADYFFPALRKTGLIAEHDKWFQESWQRMQDVIKKFPESDNTLNTAAWLASRAHRNLDEAQRLEEKALKLNPEQSAYLDTMAEIQFAKGNRAKAVEWSQRAVNFADEDDMPVLRRQLHRFRHDPFGS